MRLRFGSVEPDEWETLNRSSPTGSVFCSGWLLRAVALPVERWAVRDAGGHILLAAPVVRDGETVARQPVPLTMYQGILVAPALAALAAHRRSPVELEALGLLLDELARRYGRISLSLHHAFDDVRALLWFNHDRPADGQFRMSPRYTGIVDLRPDLPWEEFAATFRDSRRQDMRRASAAGCTVAAWSDVAGLLALYRMTFARQGLDVADGLAGIVERIVGAALAEGAGTVLACRLADGRVVAATLFLRHGDTGYYLIGATDPAARSLGVGTLIVAEHMRLLREQGVAAIDVCGVNSPRRGDFKTSFNAVPRLYFDAEWTPPTVSGSARGTA